MKNCYIHSAVSISTQNTFETKGFLTEIVEHSTKKIEAIHPNYKNFISPSSLRRMATGVKMGVAASSKALEIANLPQPEAIITGTGMGCIEDTEKFLNSIIANKEKFLTPTSFIQSTHNTVAAQIALGLKCKVYNNTYVHGGLSFESALLDAHMHIIQDEAKNVLVGGVDELGNEFIDHVMMMENNTENGLKVPFGEGASFFVLSSDKFENCIKIKAIETIRSASKEGLILRLKLFLSQNNIGPKTIDAFVTGQNGDGFDTYYDKASTLFPETLNLHYKHLSGEFYTASSFGLFIATQVLKHQTVPKSLINQGEFTKPIKTVLLYNQFKGRDHSFILLERQ